MDGILALTLKHSRDKEASDTLYKIINKFADIDIQDPVELQFANAVVSHIFNQSDINNRETLLDTIESLSGPLRGELMTAAQRFREDGVKEGIELGIELGIEQTKIDMTINCLKEGSHIQFITKVTGLSIEEIESIAKEHQLDFK